eukprot:scaffold256609_cov27-Tisochrysis_lutea.AAC.2
MRPAHRDGRLAQSKTSKGRGLAQMQQCSRTSGTNCRTWGAWNSPWNMARFCPRVAPPSTPGLLSRHAAAATRSARPAT